MILVIDIGNTETVVGWYMEERLKYHWRLSSKSHRTLDEFWILLKSCFEPVSLPLDQVKGIVISSVVPDLTHIFSQIAIEKLKCQPVIITADLDTGMEILYKPLESVGADRICNGVAGLTLYGGPLIVVDFGTATTLDVVSEKGEYLGGAIGPGVMSASYELHRLAARLPHVDLVFPPHIVGRTTEQSIQSGILWGNVSMVEGMVNRIIGELDWNDVTVIATGGLASIFVERSELLNIYEPFLTLEGMRLIYQRIC